ncbi:MAG TPA: ABC transporter permease [Caulobacteraceae bacterium]|jgi:lipopolysaccharide transport system permease protein|nr:ABC transporter permease [Caulobacteraceae bacterium]
MTLRYEAFRRENRAGTVVIQPPAGLWSLDLPEVWRYRELLYVLVMRELKVRYKQAAIGALWALVQPVVAVAIFAVIFGYFAKMPSAGVPYVVFAFAAVLPWTYFAEALRRSSTGLIGDAELIRKIYFPRLLTPLALVIAPLAEFAAGFCVLLALLAWFHLAPGPGVILLPLFLLVAMLLALSLALWLAPISVRYRDVGHALPFLIQVWLYASPVAYPESLVPQRWRALYDLNPMVGVISGFRWALLGSGRPDLQAMGVSGAVIAVLLVGGVVFFRKMERSFADVI